MSITKNMIITDSLGQEVDRRDIGAEAQNIDVSRDADGKIITDITASGVEVSSIESLAQTLKNIENNSQITLTFDDVPTTGSDNPVKSKGLVPDTALSPTSTKPVQNKIVTEALSTKLSTYANNSDAWDEEPTINSIKPVTSRGIKNALDNKLDIYTDENAMWDTEPTADSVKPVISSGIKIALDDKATKQNYRDTTNVFRNYRYPLLNEESIISVFNFESKIQEAVFLYNYTSLPDISTATRLQMQRRLEELCFDIIIDSDSVQCFHLTCKNIIFSWNDNQKIFEANYQCTCFIENNYIKIISLIIKVEPSKTRGSQVIDWVISINKLGKLNTGSDAISISEETIQKDGTKTLDVSNMKVSMYSKYIQPGLITGRSDWD